MDRIPDAALDLLEYASVTAMGILGFTVTISPPKENGVSWWLSLSGFLLFCTIGIASHREQSRREKFDKAELRRLGLDNARQLNEIRKAQRDDRRTLANIEAKLTNPPPASVSVALTGVQAVGHVGDVGVQKPKEAEKVLLAAPLLNDEKEAALREELSRVSGKVGFAAEEFMVEEMELLAKVFRESKWDVVYMKIVRFQEPIVDMIVEAASDDAAHAGFVQEAMKAIGIDTIGVTVPSLPKDQIEILIGDFTAKPSTSRR